MDVYAFNAIVYEDKFVIGTDKSKIILEFYCPFLTNLKTVAFESMPLVSGFVSSIVKSPCCVLENWMLFV